MQRGETVNHDLTQIVDPRGSAPGLVEYDPTGRVRAFVDADGNRTEIDHDGVARQEIIVDKTNARTIFNYDADQIKVMVQTYTDEREEGAEEALQESFSRKACFTLASTVSSSARVQAVGPG